MVDYFKGKDCVDPYRPHLGQFRGPTNTPPETHVANYSIETVAGAPHAFAISNHPNVLAVVAAVLGAKPTIALMSAWWSLPRADGAPEHAEMFHRDIDDYRFIKLFCYLTDVDEASGPHVFVRGSHRINKHTEASGACPKIWWQGNSDPIISCALSDQPGPSFWRIHLVSTAEYLPPAGHA